MPTPRPSRALLLTAAATTLGLALAGCSGSGGGGGNASTEWTPGPLDEYIAQIYGYSFDDDRSDEDLQAESDRQNRQVEELVATCMQEQGFDYTPVENNGGMVQTSGDDLDVEWGTLEFAEQYGYGISTDPWGSSEMITDDPGDSEYVDPNQEYREAMSESEGAAYDEALWGAPVEDDGSGEAMEYDWTTSGCYGSAQHEVYEGGESTTEYADLEDEVNRFWESVQNDPRIAELNSAWSSCMADDGHDGYTEVYGAQEKLYDEYNEIQGWDDPDYLAQTENWDWEAEPDGPPAPEVDQAKLDAFTEKEIAIAVADFTCQRKLDIVKKQQEIDHELQQDFVDQHRADLEAWAEAASAGRAK